MTLYEIDQALRALMEQIDPITGEWVGDPDAWEQLTMAREAKLEGTACLIKDIRKDIKGFDDEIAELQRRKRTAENRERWLMMKLADNLNGENFETSKCSLRFKLNPEKVNLIDPDKAMAWAQEYAPDCLRYKPATLSLADLKTEIRKGAVIPGAELIREKRLEVK